jgi:hypothetical protein
VLPDARFTPVHSGAHAHFTKLGYQHTGNTERGGAKVSKYFRRKRSNSHQVAVKGDGSFVKVARTPSGEHKTRGKIGTDGLKCGGPGSGRHKIGGSGKKPTWQNDTPNKDVLNQGHQSMLDHGFHRSMPTSEVSSMDRGDHIEHRYANSTTGAEGSILEYKNGNHNVIRYKP